MFPRPICAAVAVALCAAAAGAQEPASPAPAPPTATTGVVTEAPAEPAPAAATTDARGLDARVRKLSDDLAVALKRLPGDHRDQVFAVLPLQEAGEETQSRQLGLVVSDLIVTNLARDHRLQLTERAALKRILDEQALGQAGAVDPAKAAEVGKLAGARALVVGQVSDTGGTFAISARVVDAETAAVLATADAAVPRDELVALSSKSLVLRSKSGAMFRSLAVPGWGQAYNDEPIKAWLFGGTTATLAVLTLATLGVASFTAIYVYPQVGLKKDTPADDPLSAALVPRGDTPQDASRLAVATRQTATAEYGAAAVLGALTMSAWVLGAVEAYASGTDVESLDAALAKN